jgi:hypothetical protein
MTHDPANWTMLEQYKELRAQRDQREAKAKVWGQRLTSIGEMLVSGAITSVDLSPLPEKIELVEVQRELSLLYDQIAYLRRELRNKGMGDYL